MYAKIENNIVTYITPYAEEGCVEVPEGTVPSQIKQSDGTFINPSITFENAIRNLRMTRNSLLKKTDWTANSDVTMSDAMKTYRQQLRDAPTGLDTVEKIQAYTFPEEVSNWAI